MELTELLRLVIEKLTPFIAHDAEVKRMHDPDGDIGVIVDKAMRVLDKGLLIGRGL